jgi:outer membrane protein assembly factor BamD
MAVARDPCRTARLDGMHNLTTLPHPMHFRIHTIVVPIVVALALPHLGMAAVVFQPGKKAKFVAPGDEEISDDAIGLFQIAQTAEKEGNAKRAIHAYKSLVRRYSKDALAPSALYRAAELQEQQHDYLKAADSFAQLVAQYPGSPHFEEAIEGQFRIGEIYLAGKKLKVLGIPILSSLDHAITVFANVVRTAPYGKYTARAQFNIGLAREKQGLNDAALEAYQAVVDKFPNEPIAVDAQYQIGYLWYHTARKGTKDMAAAANAKTAFQDFLFHYPNSEKAAQARANLGLLEHKETTSSFEVAKFYDKQKYYRAAVIYYNEVIRQQPGSTESDRAKKRINQLRAKVGEAALQPAFTPAEAGKKKEKSAHESRVAHGGSAAPGSTNNQAPLPAAPETDVSLPPPASLAPDTTTAPDPLHAPTSTTSTSEASPAPQASASPEASASPAP